MMNIEIDKNLEALGSVMCDVIKIHLQRRIATRSGKENQPIDIKTAVERPILKLGLSNFRWSLYVLYTILLLVASFLFRRFLWHLYHFPALLFMPFWKYILVKFQYIFFFWEICKNAIFNFFIERKKLILPWNIIGSKATL